MRASQIILAGEAASPILYTAENISTAAHADPRRSKSGRRGTPTPSSP